MPSTQFTTIPNSSSFALDVARHMGGIPENVSEEDALAQIDPATIALILQIIQEVMKCLNNNKKQSFGRIRSYLGAKVWDRLADQMRIHSIINTWSDRLGRPRDSGDVVMIREAMTHVSQGLDENKFGNIQTEMIWLTI